MQKVQQFSQATAFTVLNKRGSYWLQIRFLCKNKQKTPQSSEQCFLFRFFCETEEAIFFFMGMKRFRSNNFIFHIWEVAQSSSKAANTARRLKPSGKQRATYVNRVIFVFVLVFNYESCKAWPLVSLRKKIITRELCANTRDLQKITEAC